MTPADLRAWLEERIQVLRKDPSDGEIGYTLGFLACALDDMVRTREELAEHVQCQSCGKVDHVTGNCPAPVDPKPVDDRSKPMDIGNGLTVKEHGGLFDIATPTLDLVRYFCLSKPTIANLAEFARVQPWARIADLQRERDILRKRVIGLREALLRYWHEYGGSAAKTVLDEDEKAAFSTVPT